MNQKRMLRRIGLLVVAVLICIGMPKRTLAETRTLYVGDILQLTIESDLSEDTLRQKFQEFEIIEMTKEPQGYSLSVRTFEIGEKVILLGDKELVIQVGSTRNDIQRTEPRDEPFEGDKRVIEVGYPFIWHILFYIAAGIFILTGIWFFSKQLRKKKQEQENPYQLFLRRCEALAKDEQYFVKLTFYWKAYIGALYQRQIIGKTSREIIRELESIQPLSGNLERIQQWLTECDRLKFTGAAVTEADKQNMYNELLIITKSINEGTV